MDLFRTKFGSKVLFRSTHVSYSGNSCFLIVIVFPFLWMKPLSIQKEYFLWLNYISYNQNISGNFKAERNVMFHESWHATPGLFSIMRWRFSWSFIVLLQIIWSLHDCYVTVKLYLLWPIFTHVYIVSARGAYYLPEYTVNVG